MFCNFCGKQMSDDQLCCAYCGRRVGLPYSQRRLERPREGRTLAGVCAALAHYLELDTTVIRLVWVLITIFSGGLGFIAYLVAWVVIPEAPLMLNAGIPQSSESISR
jgi:phage shock protein C